MYSAEKLFYSMSCKDLYYTLYNFIEEDCYEQDFCRNKTLLDFLFMLELYDLVFVASDERILLTSKGEKAMQLLSSMLI